MKQKPLQGYEDSDFEDWQPLEHGKWPNERLLWARLIGCVVTGLAIAVGLVIGGVMLVNKILE